MDFSNLVGKASDTTLALTDAEVQAISAFYDVLCLIALLLLVNIALTVFRSFWRHAGGLRIEGRRHVPHHFVKDADNFVIRHGGVVIYLIIRASVDDRFLKGSFHKLFYLELYH